MKILAARDNLVLVCFVAKNLVVNEYIPIRCPSIVGSRIVGHKIGKPNFA